jgi:hypothetical protein
MLRKGKLSIWIRYNASGKVKTFLTWPAKRKFTFLELHQIAYQLLQVVVIDPRKASCFQRESQKVHQYFTWKATYGKVFKEHSSVQDNTKQIDYYIPYPYLTI